MSKQKLGNTSTRELSPRLKKLQGALAEKNFQIMQDLARIKEEQQAKKQAQETVSKETGAIGSVSGAGELNSIIDNPKPDIDNPKPDIDTPKPEPKTRIEGEQQAQETVSGAGELNSIIDNPKPDIDNPKPEPKTRIEGEQQAQETVSGAGELNSIIDNPKPDIDTPKPEPKTRIEGEQQEQKTVSKETIVTKPASIASGLNLDLIMENPKPEPKIGDSPLKKGKLTREENRKKIAEWETQYKDQGETKDQVKEAKYKKTVRFAEQVEAAGSKQVEEVEPKQVEEVKLKSQNPKNEASQKSIDKPKSPSSIVEISIDSSNPKKPFGELQKDPKTKELIENSIKALRTGGHFLVNGEPVNKGDLKKDQLTPNQSTVLSFIGALRTADPQYFKEMQEKYSDKAKTDTDQCKDKIADKGKDKTPSKPKDKSVLDTIRKFFDTSNPPKNASQSTGKQVGKGVGSDKSL